MALQLRNQFGQLDLSVINPAAVAELSDSTQALLAKLITTHDARTAAQERYRNAVIGVREAQAEQSAALEAHRTASHPFPFVPPDLDHYASQPLYDAALREARDRHDGRVRAHRENEARKAAVAAYNSTH